MYGLGEIVAMNAKRVEEFEASLKLGDIVYNGYGEKQRIVGESSRKLFWVVENVENRQRSLRNKSIDGEIVEEK